jgi:triosephosphate isomerase
MLGKSKKVSLGAQNCHYKNSGAHTGEISPAQLKDLGVKYVIVGHSERREAGETNQDINEKIRTLLTNGITPVVCVGEKERDREGKYLEFLKNQIKETLSSLPVRDFMNIIIAYEPVWAIGKSFDRSPTGTDVHEMSLIIRKILGELFGEDYATPARIIYGGAVEPENTEDIMRKGGVGGLLVGHDSLIPQKFKEILKIADSIK